MLILEVSNYSLSTVFACLSESSHPKQWACHSRIPSSGSETLIDSS